MSLTEAKKPILDSHNRPPSRLRALCVSLAIVVIGLTTMIVAIYIHNSSSQRRVARLVGINSYLPISDSELDEAAKLEFPVGMTEQEAIQKLKRRGLYEDSHNIVKRDLSEEDVSTEYFVVILSGQQIALVNKEYLFVLEIDTGSHRIKKSEVTHGLTGL